jgi:ABC-type multidrug transport system ATPase subunit
LVENSISIHLQQVSKKFNREWIFKNLDLEIRPGARLALLGANGSGKSTLLQVISGFLIPDSGNVKFTSQNGDVKEEVAHEHISFASPFLQLNEEFTLKEIIEHTAIYKPFLNDLSSTQVIEIIDLKNAANKPLKHFSSGMKQRVKLALAILAKSELLFLDEPLSNLDANGVKWYQHMIAQYAATKTIVVCSNTVKEEYSFCEKELNMSDHKAN